MENIFSSSTLSKSLWIICIIYSINTQENLSVKSSEKVLMVRRLYWWINFITTYETNYIFSFSWICLNNCAFLIYFNPNWQISSKLSNFLAYYPCISLLMSVESVVMSPILFLVLNMCLCFSLVSLASFITISKK